MATRQNLTLHEGNDETVRFTVTPEDSSDDLTDVATLEFYLKPRNCTSDEDPLVVLLTSANVAEINIVSQSADEIVADVFIPATDLAMPYDRFYRLDAIDNASQRRTAVYGDVDVINL